MTRNRSVGVEEELHLVECESMQLAPLAQQVLRGLPPDGFAAELQASTVETNTPVCTSLDDLRRGLVSRRQAVIDAAAHHGLGVAASGTAPVQGPAELALTQEGRFVRMQQTYRQLVDEHLVCGAQVHVGVDDHDLAVRLLARVEPALPVLLALSASSPYWRGRDSGYASARSIMWQRWPTAGRAPLVATDGEYRALVEDLIASGAVSDAKMMYFDVRPSSHLSTLELRVCDACPAVDDVVLIAGMFRAMVDKAAAEDEAGREPTCLPDSLYRSAMWRAARSGLSGALLAGFPAPEPVPAAVAVRGLVTGLRPELEANGDWATAAELASAVLGRGTSADRQRARYAQRGRLSEVMHLVVSETKDHARRQAMAGPSLTIDYEAPGGDEAVRPSGLPRPSYLPVFAALERLGPSRVAAREAHLRAEAERRGLAFGHDRHGEHQEPFPVDGFPRVVSEHDWALLAAGLTQRARALEAYLRDIYGPRSIVKDGALSAHEVSGWGWRPEGRRLPPGSVRAPVMGFDVVRDELGGWRVLEDNVRVPSGIAYALTVARVARAAHPALPPHARLLTGEGVPALIGATLRACSLRADPVVALLSDGAGNSAWFEHRLIAEEAGLVLASPEDVIVEGRRVRAGGQRVDVVYLRLERELEDLVDGSGRPVGRQLLEAAASGSVAVVNAPGNGVADDKAMYRRIPDLIAYYLGEAPLLAQVPTYLCADARERTLVLERLADLVTKPVSGYGGSGVLIGRAAAPDQLEARRREIEETPHHWVGQETVDLSTVPTFVDGRLEARAVDLRAFVYLTGAGAGDAHLADAALTRVARAGTMIVNSSRGGGAKDTWILAGSPHPAGGARGDPVLRLDLNLRALPADREGHVRDLR